MTVDERLARIESDLKNLNGWLRAYIEDHKDQHGEHGKLHEREYAGANARDKRIRDVELWRARVTGAAGVVGAIAGAIAGAVAAIILRIFGG